MCIRDRTTTWYQLSTGFGRSSGRRGVGAEIESTFNHFSMKGHEVWKPLAQTHLTKSVYHKSGETGLSPLPQPPEGTTRRNTWHGKSPEISLSLIHISEPTR